jgi:hypothetical protein
MKPYLLIFFCWALPATAAGPRKINIKSAFDSFDLIITSHANGLIDGKPSALRSLSDLWPVLNNPLGNECPALNGKADAVITENGKTRSLYVKQGLVTDGKFCMNVAGEGLYFFPLHRDFLIGKSRDSIRLNSPLKVFRQGVKLFDLRRDGVGWINENKDQLLDWDFFERFENSLNDFNVRLRVQTEIAAGKPKMIVQSGGQAYEFFKITKVLWAVKKPGYAWLEASDDWSFWYDFDNSLTEDRFAAEIKLIGKPESTPEQRAQALDKLDGVWSKNLRDLYHRVVTNPNETAENKRLALNRLKRKPSLETAGVMSQLLNETQDEDLKRVAGQILKTQNPRGPLYKPTMSAAEKAKTIEFWNTWWKSQKGK